MLRRTNDVIDCTDEALYIGCRDCEGCISIESLGPEISEDTISSGDEDDIA